MVNLRGAIPILWLLYICEVGAFTPPPAGKHKSTSPWNPVPQTLVVPKSSTRLHFFFGKKDEEKKSEEETDGNDDGSREEKKLPFFGRVLGRNKEESEETAATVALQEKPNVEVSKAEAKVESPPAQTAAPSPPPKKELTPLEKAKELRATAERTRLEAERMDAQLTLEKIEKLEKELTKARKKDESVNELQEQMDALQGKLRGEAPKPKIEPKKAVSPTIKEPKVEKVGQHQPVDQEKFQQLLKEFEEAPDFTKVLIAGTLGFTPDNAEDINSTEVAIRLEMQERSDYSFLDVPEPSFTDEQIEEVKKRPFFGMGSRGKDAANMTENEYATKLLKDEYFTKMLTDQMSESFIEKVADDDSGFFEIVQAAMNKTEVDSLTEALFPKCTRKEGQSPTEAQVMSLISDVLPKASFNPSGKPEPISGGFIVRGSSKLDSVDKTVEAIDSALEKSPLGDKISVFYINDFTVFTEDQLENPFFDASDIPPVLMVLGPDVVREPQRLAFSTVSALGIGTSWYLSIYPFLVNAEIMKRVEEQMSLADSNMAYDLTWLTDLSFPLFATFIAIQLAHEAGHRLVATLYKMDITVPMFVPSFISGMTSTVTTFKSPPKNKDAMFDFAVAGPLAGIAASLAALAIGLQSTLYSDPSAFALFPALPLEILRQSTLGGGIIEFFLGSGALGVPDAALGSSAVASINIPLHPIAIAGYIGLIVNALSLLPIGTTDGGRISLALFGRGGKTVVGQFFLFVLLLAGVFGSDLFLFYFSFLIFFQQGNEIPAKNEVDDVSFSRVLLATFAGAVAFLSLIPIS